jgi:cobalt-zinc-cadmium efflux system outer membrane protein
VRGLGSARSQSAEAFERATRRTIEHARRESAAIALSAWFDVVEAQQLSLLRAKSREEAEEIARVAHARVTRGVAMPMEASLAEAEIGSAVLGERDAEGRLFEARAALKYALGLPASPDVIATDELDLDASEPAKAPIEHGGEHPSVLAARAHLALAKTDAALARSVSTTPLSVSMTAAREGTGERLFTGVLGFPLPIFDPSRFDAAKQNANVYAAEARVTRAQAEVERDRAIAAHEREHTREVRDALRTRVLLPLREAVRFARANYQAGTQDATTLLLLRQRLLDAEERLCHAVAEVKRADVRSALARGTLLEGDAGL